MGSFNQQTLQGKKDGYLVPVDDVGQQNVGRWNGTDGEVRWGQLTQLVIRPSQCPTTRTHLHVEHVKQNQ